MIGDAISPGLGTLGGALLGGYGGYEAKKSSKQRRERSRELKSLGREKERENAALDDIGREGYGYESSERGGSERPRRRDRRYMRNDNYDEEWEEGRRRRGEI